MLTTFRTRSGMLSLTVLLTLFALLSATSSRALAQSDLDAAKTASEPAPPAAAPPATDMAAPVDPGAAAAAAPAATGSQSSLLGFYYEALGLRYVVVFLSLSFAFVAIAVMCLLSMRRDSVLPSALIEGFEAHLNEKRYQEAYELAKADDSMLGRILAAGLGKLSGGYSQAIEAMQEVSDDETMKMEHRLSYVALIGTLAPMFGLLGTVDGMVGAFEEIAKSDVQPKPRELARGIQMALVTTLIGLWLAIPAIGLFGFLRNRMARLILECGILSEGLMARFGKKS